MAIINIDRNSIIDPKNLNSNPDEYILYITNTIHAIIPNIVDALNVSVNSTLHLIDDFLPLLIMRPVRIEKSPCRNNPLLKHKLKSSLSISPSSIDSLSLTNRFLNSCWYLADDNEQAKLNFKSRNERFFKPYF